MVARNKNSLTARKEMKIADVMEEFKKGKLHSGSKKGPLVKNPKQAIAIAFSETRRDVKKRKKRVKNGSSTRNTKAKSKRKKD